VDRISGVLSEHPSLNAREIARSLGATRKEVNSRLYTYLGVLFLKKETDPPKWDLIRSKHDRLSSTNYLRSPMSVMQSTGLEVLRNLSGSELSELSAKLLGSEETKFRANNIDVEISLAEMSLSDPYFEFEMCDASTMQVVINTTSVPSSLLADKEYLYGHLIHCVADAFVFRAVEQSESPMDRDDLYQFKNRVLIQLGFNASSGPDSGSKAGS
jgi:hypothetical protein